MKKISRREFIRVTSNTLALASLSGVAGSLAACSSGSGADRSDVHPNILLIMVDQMQTPPEGYAPDEGVAQGLKEILGFRPLSPENEYTGFFPGLLRLRQHAVVMRKHHTASSACVPSRACIMTGQYPNVTGVEQTDGLFKAADDVPFLDPDGTPTIGDWFRAAGYSTHYFGKWHVSEADESTNYLDPWGFSEWKKSYPEAHGGSADNSGAFRDVQCADNVIEFLKNKGEERSPVPWFAVGSLLNPHDCSIWPINWETPDIPGMTPGVVPWTDYPPPPSVPSKNQVSRQGGAKTPTYQVKLNPDGFPQGNSTLPRTYNESLNDKPQCQKDYALKWGLAFGASTDFGFVKGGYPYRSPLPFQLRGENAAAWSLGYNQFYFYLHYLADLQIRRMMQALDDSGMTGNTIVVFLSDHGEMAGAHGGMIQKWHVAYEEAVRVPMVVSSPLLNRSRTEMREIRQPTSSIDFAPTVLSLAGFDLKELRKAMTAVHGESLVKPFAGADLASHIRGETGGDILNPDGAPRPGAFFMSNDTITALCANPDSATQGKYDLFQTNVKAAIASGSPLVSGPVRQPNSVRALCTGDWKIVRYLDPTGVEKDEWELYCLKTDPVEQTNLVDFRTGEVRAGVAVAGLTKDELVLKNKQLRLDLARQEAAMHV